MHICSEPTKCGFGNYEARKAKWTQAHLRGLKSHQPLLKFLISL
jgi:ribosomal protein L37E